MSPDSFSQLGSNEIILFIKIILLAFLAIYTIFTFVVLNQVRVMNRIFSEMFASTVLMFAILGNLVFALSLFAVAFVIL